VGSHPAHPRRRFICSNVQHPTYKALAELGKAIETIFLCRYPHEEALRREIHEGLKVIERWNGANDFVFFARRGELVSNRVEDYELSMLALHLLQNCMVYINTLMMQQVLARPHWAERLTAADLRALAPLIWEHVNPYGRYELNMETRLDLQSKWPLVTRLLGEGHGRLDGRDGSRAGACRAAHRPRWRAGHGGRLHDGGRDRMRVPVAGLFSDPTPHVGGRIFIA
jgi:hypothetical protein